MSTTAQSAQAREVETDSYRYLVHPDGRVTDLDKSPVDHEVADAVRRVAELEEERERVLAVVAKWRDSVAESTANHGSEADIMDTLRFCVEEMEGALT
jgi:hypothetical protein